MFKGAKSKIAIIFATSGDFPSEKTENFLLRPRFEDWPAGKIVPRKLLSNLSLNLGELLLKVLVVKGPERTMDGNRKKLKKIEKEFF